MAKIITKEEIAAVVREALPCLAFNLPKDVLDRLKTALQHETGKRAAYALQLLIENAYIAHSDHVPLCQDTGSVWVCLEIGSDIIVSGDVFNDVNRVVASVYSEFNLRKSLVSDACFNRINTKDNTPAFTEILVSQRPGARLHIMCKGGGSDNASCVVMLTPSMGRLGIIEEVVSCVRAKAVNACPPLVIGVGIGSTFDKVASLSKMALMRPIGSPAANAQLNHFEHELLQAVNATGIGAAGLGGDTTALAVHVNMAPCHIAALPLAINMGCAALRRGTYEL